MINIEIDYINIVYSQADGTFTTEYSDWLALHPADRIFDDIVSSLRFAQQQYDSKALSVAGIGCGGGWALKVSYSAFFSLSLFAERLSFSIMFDTVSCFSFYPYCR